MHNASTEFLPDGSFILNRSVKLPEILDMLIVGGGPAGTGAAFRARELGLSALVIDFDDLMKQIRDYPKNKKILPDYGAGDKLKFPKCGELIALLRFAPIDKDELCERWKGFYRAHNVPAQVGVELIGLERGPDGVWQAKAYNHNTKSEQRYFARHVVLSLGNGAPRSFDIPGNTRDLAYRMSDAVRYVGAPVLVIGGGTSAAEAVIAVSNAKAGKNDPSAVYWSYRSSKLPKVSKALAEEYFAALTENGNIRQCPDSEPVAVVTAEDRREYLSLRTDRRIIPGRPNETAHLEFSKEYCIACIGQEIPESFLNHLGISLVAGGAGKKKRVAVTPLLESQQPNVYLIGSMLGQVYLETDDFDADPSTFREKKFAGNIKASLIDGVFVAEVIKQKLEGKAAIRVDIEYYEEAATKEEKPSTPAEVEMDLPMRLEAAPKVKEQQASLIRLSAEDLEVERFSINAGGMTTIGRRGCDLSFPGDMTLSEKHASISHVPGEAGYFLRDEGSINGVFLKARQARPLEVGHGNIVRAGRQFLAFRVDGSNYAFIHYDASGKQVNRYTISEKTMVVGREAPDVILDKSDMSLSRRHLSLTLKDKKIMLKDLGSANGTYLKIKNAIRLEHDDQFRVGQQVFTFRAKDEAPRRTVLFATAPSTPIAPSPAKPTAPSAAAMPQGMVVLFKNTGKSCPFKPGQSICDIAEKNGIHLKADCHIGSCGIDAVRILSGLENMNNVSDEEKGTLEDINGLQPGEYRLACVAKPKGPVVVEILK
jgi:thioredoxin reductase/ferredoxin/pSer/pThr/pTyr-binding forkhead associated (FHA) protein